MELIIDSGSYTAAELAVVRHDGYASGFVPTDSRTEFVF